MDNFDLKKYLVENKLTKSSQLNEVDLALPAEYKKELDDEVENVIDLFNNDLKKGQIKGTKDIDGYVNKMDSKLNSVLKYFKGDDEALESLNKYAEKIYNKAYDYFYDTIEKRDFPEKSTKQSRVDEMEDETGYENVPDDKLMDMYNEMAKDKYNMSIHVADQFVELEKEARKRGLLKNFDNFPSF